MAKRGRKPNEFLNGLTDVQFEFLKCAIKHGWVIDKHKRMLVNETQTLGMNFKESVFDKEFDCGGFNAMLVHELVETFMDCLPTRKIIIRDVPKNKPMVFQLGEIIGGKIQLFEVYFYLSPLINNIKKEGGV